MRAPTHDPRAGEQAPEQRARDADRVEENCREEFDVRFERALRVTTGERRFGFALDDAGERQARRRRELRGGALEHEGARIADAVDAVTHAHDASARVELAL